MLFLVFGEISPLREPQCLHHGELSALCCSPQPQLVILLTGLPYWFLLSSAFSPLDGDLRKELLPLGQSRFFSPHEERRQVRLCPPTGHFIFNVSIKPPILCF